MRECLAVLAPRRWTHRHVMPRLPTTEALVLPVFARCVVRLVANVTRRLRCRLAFVCVFLFKRILLQPFVLLGLLLLLLGDSRGTEASLARFLNQVHLLRCWHNGSCRSRRKYWG